MVEIPFDDDHDYDGDGETTMILVLAFMLSYKTTHKRHCQKRMPVLLVLHSIVLDYST